jgi:hypothetical protein
MLALAISTSYPHSNKGAGIASVFFVFMVSGSVLRNVYEMSNHNISITSSFRSVSLGPTSCTVLKSPPSS